MSTYEDLTVDDLKDELSNRGLKVSGTKDELVDRLEEDDSEEAPVEEAPVEESTDEVTTTTSLFANDEDRARGNSVTVDVQKGARARADKIKTLSEG